MNSTNLFVQNLRFHLCTVNPTPELPPEILVQIALHSAGVFSAFYKSCKYLAALLRPYIPALRRRFCVPYPDHPHLFIYPDGRTYGIKKVKEIFNTTVWDIIECSQKLFTVIIECPVDKTQRKTIAQKKGDEYRRWSVEPPHELLYYKKSLGSSHRYYELKRHHRFANNFDHKKYHEHEQWDLSYSSGSIESIPPAQIPEHERALQETLEIIIRYNLFFAQHFQNFTRVANIEMHYFVFPGVVDVYARNIASQVSAK